MLALALTAVLCAIPVPSPDGGFGQLRVYQDYAELCYRGDCTKFEKPSEAAHQELLGKCLIAERMQNAPTGR